MRKGGGEIDVLTQLNDAMAYIEAHITDDLALADVSSVTAYSPYHFGRLFYYIADVPMSEYIRRRKLSLAAMALQSSDIKVIDLAVLYGYDSADSFTRAFSKQHGVPPSAARQPGVHLTIFPPLTFQIKIEGVQAMNWRIEEREAFEVLGIERYFRNDAKEISAFWSEVNADGSCERLAERVGRGDLMGMCGNMEAGAVGFMYMICHHAPPGCDTTGFTVAQVPAATWAIFRSDEKKKPPYGKEIARLFRRAYTEWLPSSGYERIPGPDFEVYSHTDNGKFYEEYWIPVKRAEPQV